MNKTNTNKGKSLAGWSHSVQKKSGFKHRPESYRDVLMACDKYLRKRGLIKTIHEIRDEQFARKTK